MEDTTAAWIAALIDGEGSVMMNKRTYSGNTEATSAVSGRPHYRAVVVVAANTDYRLMDAIRGRIEVGQVYEHKVSNTAKSHNPRKSRQWTYRLNVGQIRGLMPEVRPWLVLKGEQTDLLFEALSIKETMTPGSPRFVACNRPEVFPRLDEIYAEIRALNTRGRQVPELDGGDAK